MKVPVAEAPEDLKDLVSQFFLMTMKSMLVKKYKWRVISPHLKNPWETFTHLNKINSMNTNDVWDLEEIPDGAKIVGCKRVYNTKRDSKENVERYKAQLVRKALRKENK